MTVRAISHIGGESIDGCKVLSLKTGMLFQNLLLSHAVSEPTKNVIHRDAHPTNAGFPVPFVGCNGKAWVYSNH